MSILRVCKEIFIRPLRLRTDTVKIGSCDTWNIIDKTISDRSLVICAGVGQDITFEEHLARAYGCSIILLDPSPTGQRTMEGRDRLGGLIDYREQGLAATGGVAYFGEPADEAEGSFRKGTKEDGIQFDCVSLDDLCGNRTIDLLKIDIEGYEYEVLDGLLAPGAQDVNQICVEIHTKNTIDIPQTIFSAMKLILRLYLKGYRIVYNRHMDFTFAHKRILPA